MFAIIEPLMAIKVHLSQIAGNSKDKNDSRDGEAVSRTLSLLSIGRPDRCSFMWP